MLKYKNKLKVLQITSELAPIVKAGGLGDVVVQLPKVLAKDYHIEIRIIMPKYKFIDFQKYPAELIMKDIKIKSLDNEWEKISLWKTFIPDTVIPVYLVDSPKYFPGDDVYNQVSEPTKQSSFYFLSKAALEIIKSFDWSPDVIHCHDGMTGMVSKWLKTIYKDDNFFRNIANVFTVHNLQYQSIANILHAKYLGLKKSEFGKLRKFLKIKDINITAEAIDNADFVNTVSPTYAREVLTKKYGAGLSKLLRLNKKKFTGILNGMDYHDFDPRTNPDVPVKYWVDSLGKKTENKLYLQKKLGLTQSADIPLICVISRLAEQKGLDLVNNVLEELMDMGAQFVVLGSGQESIEKVFIKAEKDHPKEIAAEIGFDANFAQTIYAGADMILMPSRFEPCGLSQIIAMRFGTIPIVRETGGLVDTVRDGYTGFIFKHYDKHAFLWAIKRAVRVYYQDKPRWKKMQITCMKKDFSWVNSAKKYIWAYKKAIKNHRLWLEKKDKIELEKDQNGK